MGSPLDTADVHYEQALARLTNIKPTAIAAMSRPFGDHVAPLGSAWVTRSKAAHLGHHDCPPCFVPRLAHATGQLTGYVMELSVMGTLRSTLKAIVDAVIARHRSAELLSPVSRNMTYSRLTRCLGRLLGTQHPHKVGVTRDMVVALLRRKPGRAASFYWIILKTFIFIKSSY
jgi:hypothetical protein